MRFVSAMAVNRMVLQRARTAPTTIRRASELRAGALMRCEPSVSSCEHFQLRFSQEDRRSSSTSASRGKPRYELKDRAGRPLVRFRLDHPTGIVRVRWKPTNVEDVLNRGVSSRFSRYRRLAIATVHEPIGADQPVLERRSLVLENRPPKRNDLISVCCCLLSHLQALEAVGNADLAGRPSAATLHDSVW